MHIIKDNNYFETDFVRKTVNGDKKRIYVQFHPCQEF